MTLRNARSNNNDNNKDIEFTLLYINFQFI